MGYCACERRLIRKAMIGVLVLSHLLVFHLGWILYGMFLYQECRDKFTYKECLWVVR